jgi:hypothetical protein
MSEGNFHTVPSRTLEQLREELDDARAEYHLALREFVTAVNLSIDIASQRHESIEAFASALSSLETVSERFHRAMDGYLAYLNRGGKSYEVAQNQR